MIQKIMWSLPNKTFNFLPADLYLFFVFLITFLDVQMSFQIYIIATQQEVKGVVLVPCLQLSLFELNRHKLTSTCLPSNNINNDRASNKKPKPNGSHQLVMAETNSKEQFRRKVIPFGEFLINVNFIYSILFATNENLLHSG